MDTQYEALNERRYRWLFEEMFNAFAYQKIVVDAAGKPVDYIFLDVNRAFEWQTGLNRERVIGKRATELFPDLRKSARDWISTYGQVALGGKKTRFEDLFEPLGRWYAVTACSLGQGYLATIFDDITERKATEQFLRANAERSRELAELLPETVFEFDLGGRITFLNRAGLRKLGFTPEDLQRGVQMMDVIAPESRQHVSDVTQHLFEGRPDDNAEFTAICRDGRRFPARICLAPIQKDGTLTGLRGILVDISEYKRTQEALEAANRRLKDLAASDELTGLCNRRRFHELLEAEIERHRRYGTPLALVMVDIDWFKRVNDTYGHAHGDRMLVAAAEAIKGECRDTDIVARYGGDEFMVLMPHTPADGAYVAAERIRQKVALLKVVYDETSTSVTVSTGIGAVEGATPTSVEDLLRSADEALYVAKHDGRNSTRVWEQLEAGERADMGVDAEAVETLQMQLGALTLKSQEALIGGIRSLAQALEARDPYTGSHSENVTRYAVGIAETMGLSDDEVASIRRAGLVHDLGKIGVPDAILRKPGPLTGEEWSVMKQHPQIGARILEQMQLLAGEVPLVRHHHERWDGRGYPDGLGGKAIPKGARVLAVADTFDAVTSDRVYRKGLSVEEALRLLKDEAGRQFDPEVVDAMIRWVHATQASVSAPRLAAAN